MASWWLADVSIMHQWHYLPNVLSFCHMVMLSVICWFRIITTDSIWGLSGFCLRYASSIGLWRLDRWSSASNESVSRASDYMLLRQYRRWPTYLLRGFILASQHSMSLEWTSSDPSWWSLVDLRWNVMVVCIHVQSAVPYTLKSSIAWIQIPSSTDLFALYHVGAIPKLSCLITGQISLGLTMNCSAVSPNSIVITSYKLQDAVISSGSSIPLWRLIWVVYGRGWSALSGEYCLLS